jgi:hypothetical protein
MKSEIINKLQTTLPLSLCDQCKSTHPHTNKQTKDIQVRDKATYKKRHEKQFMYEPLDARMEYRMLNAMEYRTTIMMEYRTTIMMEYRTTIVMDYRTTIVMDYRTTIMMDYRR